MWSTGKRLNAATLLLTCWRLYTSTGVGQGGCCNEPNFFNSHTALVQLSGALVGGPDNADNFPDSRPDYQRSEVVSLLQHLQLEASVMSSKQYCMPDCLQPET